MWEKILLFTALVGATAWASQDPDWDSGLAWLAAFTAFLTLEARDQRRLRANPERYIEHDRELFRRYEAILSEGRLRAELRGPLYNHDTTAGFLASLGDFGNLGELAEGRFLTSEIQEKFQKLSTELTELADFIARNFFTRLGAHPNDERLFLHPDIKHDRRDEYERYVDELSPMLDSVENACVEFRSTVKKKLSI